MKLYLILYLSLVTFTYAAIWKGHLVRVNPIDEKNSSTHNNPISDSIGEKEIAVGVLQKEQTTFPAYDYPIRDSIGEKDITNGVLQTDQTTSTNRHTAVSLGEKDIAIGVQETDQTASTNGPNTVSREKDVAIEVLETDQTTPTTVSGEKDVAIEVLETDQTTPTTVSVGEKDIEIGVLETEQTVSTNGPTAVSREEEIATGALQDDTNISTNRPTTKSYGCYHKDVGYIDKGEQKVLSTGCAMLSCDEDGQMHIKGCNSQTLESSCKVDPGDLQKPYPDCCYKITCPE